MRAVILAIVAGASIAQAQPAPAPDAAAPSPDPANPPPSDMPIYAPAAPAPPPPPAANAEVPPAPAQAAQAAPAATEPEPSALPAPLPPAPEAAPLTSSNKDTAWLFVGGTLTFVTAGAVLAYSTSSSEQDLRDLYTTTSGRPPVFDSETQKRYDDLTAEGRRYEVLAWTSFGLAAGCAAGAAIFFVRASHESNVSVTPMASPTTAGVNVAFSFD